MARRSTTRPVVGVGGGPGVDAGPHSGRVAAAAREGAHRAGAPSQCDLREHAVSRRGVAVCLRGEPWRAHAAKRRGGSPVRATGREPGATCAGRLRAALALLGGEGAARAGVCGGAHRAEAAAHDDAGRRLMIQSRNDASGSQGRR